MIVLISLPDETQDRRMVEMLAALADDDLTPTSSQSASQVTPNTATLEEADSILSQVSHAGYQLDSRLN